MCWSAIVLIVSCSALAVAEDGVGKLYGGLTLEQWHDRLGYLDPTDPHSASAVPPLMEIIQDSGLSADERRPFAMTLGRLGPAASDSIPLLIAQIEQRKELGKPTYAWAARALGLFGVHAKDAAPALIDLLFDEDIPQADRTLPIEALARIGSAHPDVLGALIRLLQYEGLDPSKVSAAEASVFRELAAEALGLMGPDADLAAPLLMRAVRDVRESESVRRKALVALGAMRSRAALAIPALIETLEFEQSDALRGAAGEALGKIGLPALPIMLQYLQHSNPKVRFHMACGLKQMGSAGQPATPTLIAAIGDQDETVRLAICEALAAIAPDPGPYAEPLVRLLTSELRQVRMGAMRLIVKLGPQMQPYLGLLEQLQDDPRSEVNTIARKTLEKLAGQ